MFNSRKLLYWFYVVLVFALFSIPRESFAEYTTIDIMLVYDTTASAWVEDNGGSMELFSQDAVNRMNDAMRNSDINLTFRLVHSMSVEYTYSGCFSASLEALAQGRDNLADVHTARNDYGADLVPMMVDTESDGGVVGFAFTLSSWDGQPSAAFSVNAIRSVDISHTLTHEVGHNLGAHHSKYQFNSPGPNTHLTDPDAPYSAGWYFTGTNDVDYHTIMAYNNDGHGNIYQSAPLFSTPLVNHQGTAAGCADDGDNSRVIRETMAVVAGYRDSVYLPDFSIDSIQLSNYTPEVLEPVTATVTVINQGDVARDAGNLQVWFNKPEEPAIGETGNSFCSVGMLDVGESKPCTFDFAAPATAGTKTFRAYVNSDHSIVESRYDNNRLSKEYETKARSPSVTTLEAKDVSSSSAILQGRVSPNGADTNAWFQYRKKTKIGLKWSETPSYFIRHFAVNTQVEHEILNLDCSLTYEFRTVAENKLGKTYGTIISFTTGVCPKRCNLSINSKGASGVAIAPKLHGGITDYSIDNILPGTNIILEAPKYHGSGAGRKRFTNWSGCVSSNERIIGFPIDNHRTCTVNYTDDPQKYSLEVFSDGATGVSISSDSGHGGITDYIIHDITHGSEVYLTAPVYHGSGIERKRHGMWVMQFANGNIIRTKEPTINFNMDGNMTIWLFYTADGIVVLPGVMMLLLDD